MENRINHIVAMISARIQTHPVIGLILGSGLGDFAEKLQNPVYIPYDQLEGLPVSTVEGHKGRFVIGTLGEKCIIAMQGRFHYYEGYTMQEVVLPVRVMAALGVKSIIVTNAAGGVNKAFDPGDLMVIGDHLFMMQPNPLSGKNLESFGPRFPDMSSAYDLKLQQLAHQEAEKLGFSLKTGTYMFFTGPNYETPAEVRMARFLGADAVGMSTVPEVMTACHSGVRVLGLSCITNCAAGILDQPLNHAEVIETADRIKSRFESLMNAIIEVMEV